MGTVTISMGMAIMDVDGDDLQNGKFTLVRIRSQDITKETPRAGGRRCLTCGAPIGDGMDQCLTCLGQ